MAYIRKITVRFLFIYQFYYEIHHQKGNKMFYLNINFFLKYTSTYSLKKWKELENKRPMGHIAHLRKQFKSINTYDYVIMLIKRRKK